MDESYWFNKIFAAASGLWTLVGLVGLAIVTWFRTRPSVMEKVNERKRDVAAEKASDFDRLREEVARLDTRVRSLEEECQKLRAKINECEEDRERWRVRAVIAEAEVIKYEAYHQASGEAKQEAQAYLSVERAEEEKKK